MTNILETLLAIASVALTGMVVVPLVTSIIVVLLWSVTP